MSDENFFPDMITNLPESDIPFEGLKAYHFQGENQQIIFMSFKKDAIVPEHSHEAQWAVVLDGELELTIGDETQIYRRGDTFFIPKGIIHSARIKKGYKSIEMFNQKDRYKIKGRHAGV